MATDGHDSRRKHRRSSSPDDHDKSSKRHKHRHHHSHRHRHGSKKRDEEIQYDGEIVAAVPSPTPPSDPAPRNHLPDDDVEEGEILDDEPLGGEVGKKQIESDVESGEIEVKGDRDLRSEKKNPGLLAKSLKIESEDFHNDRFISPPSDVEDEKWRQRHIESRSHEDDDDSPNHSRAGRNVRASHDALGNGYLDVKSSKGDKWQNGEFGHFKGNEILKGDYNDEALEANRKEENSHRNASESGEEKHRMPGNSPLHDGYRSRSRSIGHTRDRSPSRSAVEEYVHPNSRHSREKGSLYYTSRHKTDYDLDEERVSAYRREHRHGSKDLVEGDKQEHSTRYQSREARDRDRATYRSRDRDVDRDLHREKKGEETNKYKEVDWMRRREKERGRSHDRPRRDIEKDRSRERDEGRDRRREKERDRSRDTVYERDRRREMERDMSKDRTRGGERDRDWKSEWDYRNRERDSIKERERRDDRYRHNDKDAPNGKDKHMRREDGNDSGDRYKKHSRHEENGHHTDRKRNYTMEEDGRKLKGEIEQDDVDEDTLQLPEQEEEDLNRIKEESRRRREAIMEKYKKQNQKIEQAAGNEGKGKGVEIHTDIFKAVDGKSDDVDNVEPSFSVGKSPPENVNVRSEKVPGAGGLGEGTPKSERSADKYCDDIFGETPTGVRKSGKGDGLLIERVGLHDNWDDAEGYYSYRFGEILDGRYEVTAAHGKGVFSTVVRAKNLKTGNGEPDEVAIKIIRNNDTMYKAGLDELVILKKLVGADPDDKRHCVRFLSSFKLTAVRAYAKQLFIALKHLRNCGVLHCDIKPDNMLVNEAKNVLKLCDFGNAMFAGKNEVTPYLVSRFYRAPEIILGLQYDHPLDIWSVGCCLYELYTGKVLFPGLTNNDMLRLHMELKGPFPKKMLRKGAFTEQHYDQDLSFHSTEEDPVTKKTIKRMILNIKAKDIGTIITGSPGEDPKMLANFKDLLDKIFVLDPDKRLTVSQALNHPFITGK